MTVKVNCTLFYASWCGHCVDFKPKWEEFKNMIKGEGKIKGGNGGKSVRLETSEYESASIPNDDEGKIAGKDVDGYPTLRITVSNKQKSVQYQYGGKRDIYDLYNHMTKVAPLKLNE